MTPASGSWVPDGGGGVTWSGDPAEEPSEGADWTDSDYDGLPNWLEEYLGTDLYVSDTDYDGIFDGDEVNVTGTNPTLWDSDGNGVSDSDDYYYAIHGCYPWDQPQPQQQCDQNRLAYSSHGSLPEGHEQYEFEFLESQKEDAVIDAIENAADGIVASTPLATLASWLGLTEEEENVRKKVKAAIAAAADPAVRANITASSKFDLPLEATAMVKKEAWSNPSMSVISPESGTIAVGFQIGENGPGLSVSGTLEYSVGEFKNLQVSGGQDVGTVSGFGTKRVKAKLKVTIGAITKENDGQGDPEATTPQCKIQADPCTVSQ